LKEDYLRSDDVGNGCTKKKNDIDDSNFTIECKDAKYFIKLIEFYSILMLDMIKIYLIECIRNPQFNRLFTSFEEFPSEWY
jgi:hypothetical protein